MPTSKPNPILLLSDARGVYIPRDFAREVRRDCVSGVSTDQWAALEAGPDIEGYWDTWVAVEDGARITDPVTQVVYSIYQDGDCWLIPTGMEWDDTRGCFAWSDVQS